jgi:hypothetical protein
LKGFLFLEFDFSDEFSDAAVRDGWGMRIFGEDDAELAGGEVYPHSRDVVAEGAVAVGVVVLSVVVDVFEWFPTDSFRAVEEDVNVDILAVHFKGLSILVSTLNVVVHDKDVIAVDSDFSLWEFVKVIVQNEVEQRFELRVERESTLSVLECSDKHDSLEIKLMISS